MIVLYYLIVLVVLGPWMLLLLGALRRLRLRGGRLRRVQAEGAALVLLAGLARWAAFDPRLANGYAAQGTWPYWLTRGTIGLACIGVLLLVLGFFLERRPRPGMQPWPQTGRKLAVASILVGAALGLAVALLAEGPWLGLPWGPGHVLFSLGFYPFATVYAAPGRAVADSAQAVDD